MLPARSTLLILDHGIDVICDFLVANSKYCKHRRGLNGRDGIEENHAAIGRNPVFAVTGLQKIVDGVIGQPLRDRIIDEAIAVKSRQPFVRANQ